MVCSRRKRLLRPSDTTLAFARVDFFHPPLELTADRLGFLSEAKDEGSFHNE
jgi:hypothetical protein